MPASRELSIRGTPIHMLQEGRGPALLFLHGAGGAGRWLPFQERLAKTFSVYFPSHPGHGGSPAAEWIEHISDLAFHYLDVLDELGLARPHLVGASLGGWIAAEIATMASHRLASLVLIDPVGIRVDGWIYPFLFAMDIPEIVTTVFHNPMAALALAPPDQSIETLALQYRQGAALARVAWPLRGDVGEGDSRGAPARVRRLGPCAAPRGARRGGGCGERVLPPPGRRRVKFYYFHLMPYIMDHDAPSSWVTLSNRHYDPGLGHTLYNQYLDQFEHAERLGWDGLCVNEHHQNCYGTMPSPNVVAAMLVRRTTKAKIAILGNGLPLRDNPLRVAEEIAMLDVVSGGRVISGFVRGISAEYFSTAVNPTHSRERFYEAAELILRSWTEEGPFPFDGRYYRYPYA